MPRYDYKCQTCRTITEVQQSFTDEPLTTCDDCGGSISRVYNSVSVASSALPTRSDAGFIDMDTKRMHADVAAYKRLRKDGLQPKTVKGSARLESTATSKWEVETNTSIGGNAKLGRRLDETQSAINRGERIE
jgi:putative FmdB family regulatory protein